MNAREREIEIKAPDGSFTATILNLSPRAAELSSFLVAGLEKTEPGFGLRSVGIPKGEIEAIEKLRKMVDDSTRVHYFYRSGS